MSVQNFQLDAGQDIFRQICRVIWILCVGFCVWGGSQENIANAANPEDVELKICRDAHTDLKTKFQKTKEAVDYTVDKFKRFNSAAKGWRTSVTRRNQDQNIKGISDVMDSVNEDALKAALAKVLGDELVGYIEEAEKLFGLKLADRINLWQIFARDPRKAYDYMYDLSAIDRKLRDSGVYRKMESVQKVFDKAGGYINKAGDMISFVEMFDPNQVSPDSPTSSLKAIENVLEEIKTISDKIPGLGHLIGFYIEATKAFSGALDRLDKKLVEARQGAMCGQLGRFSIIKPAFESDCPDCNCLGFLSINDEFPLLEPAKGWEDTQTSDYYIFIDADRHSMVDKRDFDVLYHGFAALSRQEATRGVVNKEMFYAYLLSAGQKFQATGRKKNTMGNLVKEMKDIYSKISDPEAKSRFIKVLRKSGQLPENSYDLIASAGVKYSLWRQDKRLFDGLYVFDTGFRTKIKALAFNYADKGIGSVKLIFSNAEKLPESHAVKVLVNGEATALLSSTYHEQVLTGDIIVPWNVFSRILIQVGGYTHTPLKWRFNSLSDQAVIRMAEPGEEDKKEELEPEPEAPEEIQEKQKDTDGPRKSETVSAWEMRIDQAWQARDWETLIAIRKELLKENEIDPVRQINGYLQTMSAQKWDWFKKDVARYLDRWERASDTEYGILERTFTQMITKNKGTKEDLDRCMEQPEKEARNLRKHIRVAKKDHKTTLDTLFEFQGNSSRILEEIDAFLKKFQIPETLEVSVQYSSPCGNGIMKNKSDNLELQIQGSHQVSISVRETLTFEAIARGGKAPVAIRWEGDNISANGSRAVFAASIPGRFTVQATATDAFGETASDMVAIQVKSPVEGILHGLPDRVFYGSTLPVRVKDTVGNTIDGGYTFVWMADKEGIEFDPPTSTQPLTRVTFGNIGQVTLWAQIVKNAHTAGEAQPAVVIVMPPQISIRFIPERPYVSQKTRAVLNIFPEVPGHLIDFRWFLPGENVREFGEQEKGRAYLFSLKDTQPAQIKVLARIPFYGETLKDIQASILGTPYTVEVSVSKPVGPPPMVWEGKKLVEAAGQIAVHQNITLTADITPAVPGNAIHYFWTLNPDSHFAGGESGRSITVNRSRTGTCTATVSVLDKDNILLGKGSGAFEVTISQEQLAEKEIKRAVNSLDLETSVYKPGDKISLDYTSQGKYPGRAWVGMFMEKAPHAGAAISNAYKIDSRYLGQQARGTIEFKAPVKKGKYEFRMFEETNGKEVFALKFEVR
ncbi:MAG: PKD domain-containing protein [Proteobacteria bacterium]|nr:PKD domain-containing protein [Pseudomonadota bacterium]MBU1387458.1 PKD domain-containing protein [Pseudomonadota bacterium]MBU1541955.1 PKD domain-containing protein [Pseudomonadota bacterium]MBU2430895.1 PKD domain-containing protein [Pseudomonadota bacterium]MBU2479560.1 PKD domain-containing protein [Pseudomonadota bacterium]